MTLIGPILDDRTYADLKQELVKRIPAYAPEWTDHNESDPGIVLLELFAHLGESLLFRFNQIPDATKVAFLRLLGVQPRPAQLARTLLTLRTERPDGVHVLREAEARAGAIVFQTSDEVHAWPLDVLGVGKAVAAELDPSTDTGKAEHRRRDDAVAKLSKVEVARAAAAGKRFYEVQAVPADPLDAEAKPLDVSLTADQSLWVALLARSPQQRSALPGALAGSVVYLGVVLDTQVRPRPFDLVARDSDTATKLPAADLTADPPAVLWELWNGPSARPADPALVALDVVGDTTRGITTTGVVKLTLPDRVPEFDPTAANGANAASGSWDGPPPLDDVAAAARVVAWLRARRPSTENDAIHRVRWVGVNAVEAVQARTATAELLGTGTGDPGQTYRLTQRPVVPASVRLEVEEVDGWHRWAEVETLAASRPTEKHFTVDLVAGLVTFGSRTRVPQLGQRIRVTSYQYGGGGAGNVAAGAVTSLTGVAGVKVTNVLPATGGADAASLAEALDEIPAEVHRRDRVVTEDDYRVFARQVPGVRRAETIPLLHPDTPTHRAAGVVSVVVFPEEDLRNPSAPEPDVALLRQVAAYLNPRRPITSELYVIPPTYRKIAISIGVHVRGGYQVDAVRRWVELILRQYLAPVPPYGPDGGGWPLGRAVRRAELEAVAVQVDGVEYVEDELRLAQLGPDDSWSTDRRLVELRNWEVPQLAAITVVRGTPLEPAAGYPAAGAGPGSGPVSEPPVLVPLPPDVC